MVICYSSRRLIQHGVQEAGGNTEGGAPPDTSEQEAESSWEPVRRPRTDLKQLDLDKSLMCLGGSGIYTTGKKFKGNLEVREKCEKKFAEQDNYLLRRKQKAERERKQDHNGPIAAITCLVSTGETPSKGPAQVTHLVSEEGAARKALNPHVPTEECQQTRSKAEENQEAA